MVEQRDELTGSCDNGWFVRGKEMMEVSELTINRVWKIRMLEVRCDVGKGVEQERCKMFRY